MALKLASALSVLLPRNPRKACVPALRLLFLLLFCLLLSACQSRDSADYIFDNYLYRLSNSLQVEKVSALPAYSLLSYPARRDLQKDIPRININLLDFLRLSECELQRHVGQRNGALGRVMGATQQLIYDAIFLSLARQCLTQLQAGSALANTLETAYKHKQKYLPASMWNASFASKEFSYLFSLGATPLTLTAAKEQPLQLINSLKQLQQGYLQLLESDLFNEGLIDKPLPDKKAAAVFLDNIESYYQVVESSKRLGEIRLSLQTATYNLQQADRALYERIEYLPLCQKQQTNNQFTIVDNVFHKYYIGQVQPYLAALHQQSNSVFLEIDGLLNIQQAPSNIVSFWNELYRNDDSEWQRFNRAIKTHTLNWQALLKQCGMLPS
ncbi:MAG: hypothetical protein ACI8VC_000295 [Candidatus Endobugula sp.]|jgi:hypothetical protein